MKEYSNLTVLIVDPNVSVRGNLHNMLNQCDITKIEYAVSSGTAIRQVLKKPYDIILCEYDLGNVQEGQDGQQLLEDLRQNKLIALWTIFIIITSERVYGKVVSAAELAPTDYILKPFTVDTLIQRIGRAVDRRSYFFTIHQQMGQGNLREAIKTCQLGESKVQRYAADFARLRADLHLNLDEPAEAEKIYQRISDIRPIPWAQLGLAKTMYLQERFVDAEAILSKLVAENDKFMDAYDWLAKTYQAQNLLPQAQRALEGAVAKSPHIIRRLRKLGEIAFESGDVDTAERAFKQVVAKAKYSEFRDPEDHVKLVQTLVKKGDAAQAAGVIRDLEKSLRGNEKTAACRAISTAMLYEATGNSKSAIQELTEAVDACRQKVKLSGDMKVTLARSCLNNNLDEAASEVMSSAMDDAAAGISMAKAMGIFEHAGRHDLAVGFGNQLKQDVQKLISLCAEKTAQSDFKGATVCMIEATIKAPGDTRVIFGAAAAIQKQLDANGWDYALGEQARLFIEKIREAEPTHPQLHGLISGYQATQRKYGIAA